MPELPLCSPFAARFSKADADALAERLKLLASRTRLRILHLLHAHGALTLTQMARLLELSQANLSHHLHVLESARLVEFVPSTNSAERPRRLNPDRLAELAGVLTPDGDR